MSTTACPGCGLPREVDRAGVAPCPVCHAPDAPPAARPVPTREPDPTAGLPADVSELGKYAAPTGTGVGTAWVAVLAFALGAAAGIGGAFAWRGAPPKPESAAALTTPEPDEPLPVPMPAPAAVTPPVVHVAPMPHEPPPPEPAVAPEPRAVKLPPPPIRLTIITLNEPDLAYTVPTFTKKGEHVILKGRVKSLKVSGLDHGALVDASELVAGTVYVGKVAGNSVLKIHAPNGIVTLGGVTEGKSVVQIDAPGGDVKFSYPTAVNRPGSRIDGGSVVTVAARSIDFRGDITGEGTRVTVNLDRLGILKVASVNGPAVVEYRTPPTKTAPDVTVGPVAPTAVFRRVE